MKHVVPSINSKYLQIFNGREIIHCHGNIIIQENSLNKGRHGNGSKYLALIYK